MATTDTRTPFDGALGSAVGDYDPRAARFGMSTNVTFDGSVSTQSPEVNTSSDTAMVNSNPTLLETRRPLKDAGGIASYSDPTTTTNSGRILQIHWSSGTGGYSSSVGGNSSRFYDGLLAQNDPAVTITAKDGTTQANLFYEDADGIARRAMSVYLPSTISFNNPAPTAIGLPQPVAENNFSNGIGTPTVQSQSRPFILNRPFRSVGEMSYTWRGAPWKNIDFFCPESGDTGLLDVFCIDDPPADALAASKVNLNTHQIPVLKSLIAGAYLDETNSLGVTNSSYTTVPSLNAAEANAVATELKAITTGSAAWRGPLTNVGDLVGRYIGQSIPTNNATDQYTYTNPAGTGSYTYAGLPATFNDQNIITWANANTQYIQKFREASIRALSGTGQTRVWNLMIDVVAQTGRYAPNASDLSKFTVDGEARWWVHVAIDRYTGQTIDKQVEIVSE